MTTEMKCWLLLGGMCLLTGAVAQEGPSPDRQPRSLGPLTFQAHKTSNPPSLDGEIQEGEWNSASTATGFLTYERKPERGKTTFHLQYDAIYVYFAVRVRESSPPRATIKGTNVSLSGDDVVQFQLDTFGEGRFEDFSRCAVNGLGATSFYKSGGSSQKREWLGEFEAKAKVDPDGWQVEARVPWSILRIPKSGVRDLRFNFYRSDTKHEESSAYMQPRDSDPVMGAHWRNVDVPRVRASGNQWKLLPSVTAAAGRGRADLQASLDVRGFLNDKFEVSGVLFPDFSLINRVASHIGFSHFEVLPPETRPLFQEGSGYFNGVSGIFASQRIRRFDLGLRMYGSPTPSTKIGVNNTVAFDGDETLAASYQNSLAPGRSYSLGVTSLRGKGLPGNEALAMSFDAMSGPYYFGGSGALSSDAVHRVGSSFSFYGTHRFGNTGFSLGASQVDRRFFPRLGYIPESGVRSFNTSADYGYSADRRWLSSASVGISHSRTWDTSGPLAHESSYGSMSMSIRHALSAYVSGSAGSFDGTSESSGSVSLYLPNSNALWSVGIGSSWFRFGDEDSVLRDASFSYRDRKSKWALSAGWTEYRSDTVEAQNYASFTYKLTPYDGISFNLLNDRGKTNGSIQYARRNNRGIEYFIALGDPSADHFTPAIVTRIVIPIK